MLWVIFIWHIVNVKQQYELLCHPQKINEKFSILYLPNTLDTLKDVCTLSYGWQLMAGLLSGLLPVKQND